MILRRLFSRIGQHGSFYDNQYTWREENRGTPDFGFRNVPYSAFEVLGVPINASEDDVKTAYRKLAMQHHPDRFAAEGQDAQKEAEVEFRKINEAYETIKKYKGFS
ncbi:MAG: DnaJ domain-containing protein [Bacteroidia bacterium]|nr:DnaJ domain-containing protein [Bacteroidia bacterium]